MLFILLVKLILKLGKLKKQGRSVAQEEDVDDDADETASGGSMNGIFSVKC